ncbi:MAG TPA: hypothetical protein VFH42_03410, partial [Sporolactobacillaceae bacterium]|nr:hypothetical protein [Sporolactobacillaceae bacterium]
MSKRWKPYWPSFPITAITAIAIFYILWVSLYQWVLGVVGLVVFLIGIVLARVYKNRRQRELEAYVSKLSHRVKKVGEEALLEMPIGILLYSPKYTIEWMNHYLMSLTKEESYLSGSLNLFSESLIPFIKNDKREDRFVINKRRYKVIHHKEERLLYFFDITEAVEVRGKY